jgi:hypothetical protein
MPRLDLVDDHLRRSSLSTADPYHAFDAAWKAFNVLYEAEYREGMSNQERDLIPRAVQRLESVASDLLDRLPVEPFLALDPIFEEKAWERSGEKKTGKHDTVRKQLQRRFAGRSPVADLQALVDALYVVRCNLAHGFKTPDGPRDREVLTAAAPLVVEITTALRGKWSV